MRVFIFSVLAFVFQLSESDAALTSRYNCVVDSGSSSFKRGTEFVFRVQRPFQSKEGLGLSVYRRTAWLVKKSNQKYFKGTGLLDNSEGEVTFYPPSDGKSGTLLPGKSKSHLVFDGKEKNLVLTFGTTLKNEVLSCRFDKETGEPETLSRTALKLMDIGGVAEVANGDWDLDKKSVVGHREVREIANKELKEIRGDEDLDEEGNPGCSYALLTDTSDVLASIAGTYKGKVGKKGLAVGGDKKTAQALRALSNEHKILAMYAIVSDNDISCSTNHVRVFAEDGYLLEINNDWGD